MAAKFAYINLRTTWYKGSWVTDLALPGDEQDVIGVVLRRALEREERFTPKELDAYLCTHFQLKYDIKGCIAPGCTWCRYRG